MPLADPIVLDELQAFTKLDLARIQLERALILFLDEADYVCAITLAGASEEILGKLLEAEGKQSTLSNFVDCCIAILRHDDPGAAPPAKVFVRMANEYRDGLKHYTDGNPTCVPREAAVEILDRASRRAPEAGFRRALEAGFRRALEAGFRPGLGAGCLPAQCLT